MAEKPLAEETAVPDTTGLMQAVQEGKASEDQLKAVYRGLRLCPICHEPRGTGEFCQHCGMR